MHELMAEEQTTQSWGVKEDWARVRKIRHALFHGEALTVAGVQARWGGSPTQLPVAVHDLELCGFKVERARDDETHRATYRITNPDHVPAPHVGPRYNVKKKTTADNNGNAKRETKAAPVKVVAARKAPDVAWDYPPLGAHLRVVMVAETPDDMTAFAVVLADEHGHQWFAHVDQNHRATGGIR